MTEAGKVKLTHTRRTAFVYIRQSSPQQVENNRESVRVSGKGLRVGMGPRTGHRGR